MSVLDLLPARLRAQNRLEGEISLPYPEVLEAVDVLEANSVLLLGWEPLGAWADGGFGSYPSPAIGGLAGIEIPAAAAWDAAVRTSAALHRRTIEEEWRTRERTPPVEGVELIFCVTARLAR